MKKRMSQLKTRLVLPGRMIINTILISCVLWGCLLPVSAGQQDKREEQLKRLIRKGAKNEGNICSPEDLLSSDGAPGAYNKQLAVLGALAASDVYNRHGRGDAVTLLEEGFQRVKPLYARVEFGEGAVELLDIEFGFKGLEAITLEKKVITQEVILGKERFVTNRVIAIVFEGSDELGADWMWTNARLFEARFPYWYGKEPVEGIVSTAKNLKTATKQKEDIDQIKAILAVGVDDVSIEGSDSVHLGFRTAAWDYMMMEGKIEFSDGETLFELIRKAKHDPTIHFLVFGHSMGGAVASLYACELVERGIRPTCYTYGCAATSYNDSLQQSYAGRINYHSFVHSADPIRMLTQDHSSLFSNVPQLCVMQNTYYYTGNTDGTILYSKTPANARLFSKIDITGWKISTLDFNYHSDALYSLHAYYDSQEGDFNPFLSKMMKMMMTLSPDK